MKPFRVHDRKDRAYVAALAFGDFHVSKHGRKVRIEASSTHPAQIDLVTGLFNEYGKQIRYPIRSGRVVAWRVTYNLDRAFSFLFQAKDLVKKGLSSSRLFYSTLSGLTDSEGHVGLTRRGDTAYPVLTISNTNRQIMQLLHHRLRCRGYPANLEAREYSRGALIYEVSVRGVKALNLLRKLNLRHREKVLARSIVLHASHSPKHSLGSYRRFRRQLELERDAYVLSAIEEYRKRKCRKAKRVRAFERVTANAVMMRREGLTIEEIAKSLNRSKRTVYRLLGRKTRYGIPEETEQANQGEKPVLAQARVQPS
ncbi:MAG: helix-turn-helix domain-containing protein [Nitrososphaerales archaeon]|nr:helix-turn-helix domain-containing protein [Nitrososphaerales archaeon]